MYFIAHCLDRPDALELRASLRPEHLRYLDSISRVIVLAGPYLDGGGNSIGSMLIFETDSKSEAEHCLHNDPYFKGSLFGQVTVLEWHWGINPPKQKTPIGEQV